MKKLAKVGLLTIALTTVFGTSVQAANIMFDTASTRISEQNGKWASQAYTEGSYGTKYSRTYTEIWYNGKKVDWDTSRKEEGKSSYAVAYAPIKGGDVYSTSNHRIWYGKSDDYSIQTSSRDEI